ncbi:Protein SRX-2 [Aphelenchoides avenae]|nr:Protein SRX-2 [Aphelenchus avenae]
MPELSKVLTGCAVGVVSFVALFLNVSVLTVLIGGKFLKANSPTVYIITFLNVVGDAMQVGLILVYLTPSSIAQSWLFPYGPDGAGAKTFAYLFQIQWYQFVMVLLPEWKFLFSRSKVIVYCSLVFPSSFVLSFIADIILPCCTTYYYYGKFSYSFFGNGTNYKNLAMDIPLNSITSGTSLTCYAIIFIVVWRTNRNNKVKINSTAMLRRRQNEIRYALQFGLISLFFLGN